MQDQSEPSDDLLSVDEAIDLLRRFGWKVSDLAFHVAGRGMVWIVAGSHGAERLQVEGASMGEAWRKAVQQAQACGMLEGDPRPSGGRV
jgi:hypothetical protein